MTAVILEDEALARNRLTRLIEQSGFNIEILAKFDKVLDIANYLIEAKNHPDLAFLDIQVTDGNSFELFNVVEVKSKVIFTTAYDQYAVSAFRYGAIDYLMKPIKQDQLNEAISKASRFGKEQLASIKTDEHYKSRFLIRFGKKLQSVKTEEIAYVYSKDKIVYFHTFDNRKIPSDHNLQILEPQLDPSIFFRANRQIIVNLESIADISRINASRLKLKLEPALDEKIVISTERTKSFKKWMDR